MPLAINLRHLEADRLRLKGELPAEELELDSRDEMIAATRPVCYDLEVQRLDDGLLAQGRLRLALDCQCVRCLKAFQYELELDPWACHLPLEGEDRVPVVNDCVDLTPLIREDILLEFPQHPLCRRDCRGLPKTLVAKKKKSSGSDKAEIGSAVWSELNKLKL